MIGSFDPLSLLGSRWLDTPLALHPLKAEMIVAGIDRRLARSTAAKGRRAAPNLTAPKGYEVVAGVAIIRVEGALVYKLGTLRPENGMTGYDGIRHNFLAALDDKRARAIVLDIDSTGGEMAGCLDLSRQIVRGRSRKPIWAVCSETALAGAYAIASAAHKVIVPRTGYTGSVGIIAMHIDMSGALANNGVAVSFIKYGDRKTDLAREKPLSSPAKKRIQADVDAMGEMFANLVASNRGMKASKVQSYQGATFMGARGVKAGLADAVMAPDKAFNALLRSIKPAGLSARISNAERPRR